MAQVPSAKAENQTPSYSTVAGSPQQKEEGALSQPFGKEATFANSPECTSDEERTPTISKPRQPESGENRLRPAADVLNRIIWDPNLDSADYIICYEDRFEGRLEAGLSSWRKDFTDEEFIPQHRILSIRRRSDGEVVWDRRRRTDKIFFSGNSAFDYLGFLA